MIYDAYQLPIYIVDWFTKYSRSRDSNDDFLFVHSYRSIMMRSTHCKISFNGSAHQQKDGRAHCHPEKDNHLIIKEKSPTKDVQDVADDDHRNPNCY